MLRYHSKPPKEKNLIPIAFVFIWGTRDANVRSAKLYIDIDATYLRQVARELDKIAR